MSTLIDFGNGIRIREDTINNISNQISETLKRELPEAAQNIIVIRNVLSKVEEDISCKKICL